HDGPEAELGEAVEHAVQPVPVEPAGLGLDAVPGHAPAHQLGPDLGGEAEVRVPPLVVLREGALVEGALPRPRLRDERVLDADPDVQGPVLEPPQRTAAPAGPRGPTHGAHPFSPVVATDSMKRRCTRRKATTRGRIAMSEPAIITPYGMIPPGPVSSV